MKKKEVDYFLWWFTPLTIILTCALIYLCVKLGISRYNEACKNIPSVEWLEEDLQIHFLTTDVSVIKIERNSDNKILVKARVCCDEGVWTRTILYKVSSFSFGSFHWEFVRWA